MVRTRPKVMRPRARAVDVASSCGDMALLPAPVAGPSYVGWPVLGEVFFEIPAAAAGHDGDGGAVAVGARAV